jgi:hypothetical protein
MGPALQVIGLVVGLSQMSAAQDNMARAEEASRNAAAAQKQAAEAQQRQQELAASRERRQAIRAGIVQRARLRAQAQVMGAGGGSGVAGGISSISSQIGANLGFGTQMTGLGREYTAATGRAADFGAQAGIYQARASSASQMSSMGFSMFGQAGGFGSGSIFSGFGGSSPSPFVMNGPSGYPSL